LSASIAEPEALEQFGDSRARRGARHLVHGREEVQVLADRQVLVQREALRHVADAPLQRLGVAGNLVAEHVDLAGARAQQAAQHADRRRFSGPIRPEEAVHLAFAHGEIDVVDGHERAEAFRQSLRVNGDVVVHGARVAVTGSPAGRSAAAVPSSASSARYTSRLASSPASA
jgi:hypothetical protein